MIIDTKFDENKEETAAIVPYLHELLLGKYYTISMLKCYSNLRSNKASIYMHIDGIYVNIQW